MIRSRVYREDAVIAEDFPVADISEYAKEPGTTIWVDLTAPDGSELEVLAEEFGLHALALEHVVAGPHPPRLIRVDGHLFLTAYAIRARPGSAGGIESAAISAFVTSQALITVHSSDFDIDELTAVWDSSPDLAKCGVGFLLYGLLDLLVDSHLDTLQVIDNQVEALEDLLFADRPQQVQIQRDSFEIRKRLVLLRRAILPMREMVNSLLRRDLHTLDDVIVPYLQDVYDHVMRATEWAESLRELVGSTLEANLAIQGNRLNDIMKKVTSWAAIIAVPTAITGFYGQNIPYPGFGDEAGFLVSTSLIVLLSAGLFVFFRRKDWI